MSVVLVIGNPVDGVQLIGPFADGDDVNAYTEDVDLGDREWWIAELTPPLGRALVDVPAHRVYQGPKGGPAGASTTPYERPVAGRNPSPSVGWDDETGTTWLQRQMV